jgi:L-seryl-tRNA(Ser) seleniumtransferase
MSGPDRLRKSSRRAIPAVEKLLQKFAATDLPRPLVAQIVRREVARERSGLTNEDLSKRVAKALEELRRTRLQPVINGTGILLHTNFGRAPLPESALEVIAKIGTGYSNLEFDLANGTRGGRGSYCERTLALLCGAEAALVVNNCAAALVLIARHFTRAKPEIVISRGEMVQIGGEFRVGEILLSLGAKLREVGATNKTALADYERAITKETALILKVHRSNFFMDGFVANPSPNELARLAKRRRIPFVEDLGSGAILATETFSLGAHEPTPNESLRAGADLVCFSGDKLFGGPQAGIIAGKARFVRVLRRDPLFRALRCDKLILAALQATAELHLGRQSDCIPLFRLMRTPLSNLQKRARKIIAALRPGIETTIEETESEIGGGALPRARIKSIALVFRPRDCSVDELATRLREMKLPVIGYVARKTFRLDLRTVFPEEDASLIEALRAAFA